VRRLPCPGRIYTYMYVYVCLCIFMYILCISYVYLLIYNVPGQVCKDFRVPAADGLVKVGFHGLYMAYVGHTRM